MHVLRVLLVCLSFLVWNVSSFQRTGDRISSERKFQLFLASEDEKISNEKSKFLPFWMQEDRVKFSCTGCGRCCQNDGEVWFNAEEFTDLVLALNMPVETAIDLYVDEVKSAWVKIKNSIVSRVTSNTGNPVKEIVEQCIFLSSDGKQCTVYDQRPVQCRTYPYWPNLLKDVKVWKKETVVPENVAGPHWNPVEGGCEGIDHINATIIAPKKIFINKQLFDLYHSGFPIIKTDADRSRLILKVDVMKNIIRSTQEWVKEFVIKYNLCPFAQQVFETGKVRYRVFLVVEKEAVIEKLKLEVLYLLSQKPEEVETTLLMFPFVFKSFKEFYEFSLELEDEMLPTILDDIDQFANKYNGNDPKKVVKRLFKTPRRKEKHELQLACFHPEFQWADCPGFNQPLNFEKRAPYPTINILRSQKIQALASELKTRSIANHNANVLEAIGGKKLTEEFARCLDVSTNR